MKQQFITTLVSIAIPAYKKSFLAEAIKSALAQDYGNIELIIVNDCSPQNLDSVVAQYDDPRIRYYKNEENLGKQSIVLNWNKCLSLARGEFFILLCDDDVLLPNCVSELVGLAKKYPLCNVFHARKTDMHENGSMMDSPQWPEYEDFDTFIQKVLNKERHHTVTEFMMRTKHIQPIGYINFPVGYYSDRASILSFCKVGGIVSSSESLVRFRYSDEHITSSPSPIYSLGKARAAIDYWQWIHQFPIAHSFEQQIREDVECTLFYAMLHSPFWQKIQILKLIPNKIVSKKIIFSFIYRIIMNND